jgi:hypothetical protein
VSAADLLDRLERVTQHQPDRWRAICPAHESRHRTQSLAVRELPDGTLLIRCHAGCCAADVVAAVGLELADLFAREHSAPTEPRRPQRPKMWHAMREAVRTLHTEVLVVAVGAENLAQGIALTPRDRDRLIDAATRIRSAVEACQ